MQDKNGWIEQNTGDCVGVEVIGREVVGGFITQAKNGW